MLTINENKRGFLRDGKPFFWLGDTAWLLFKNLTDAEIEIYLRNRVLYPLNESFRFIATGKLFKIGKFIVRMPTLVAILLILVMWFILRRTTVGRKVYFTGSNEVSARFSGINTDRVKIAVYVASGLIAAFSGLMYVAKLNACEPGLGTDSNFEAITVALIGGFAMSGGYGNIWGVAGGALVTYTIQSGMNSLQMPGQLHDLISGALMLFGSSPYCGEINPEAS